MKRLAIVITSAFPLNVFLRPHLERLKREFEVTVYTNTADMGVAPDVPEGVMVVHLGIHREISLWADLETLWRLWRILGVEGYDVLFSMTPKSGLLGMMAGYAARVPRRVHCFTGQVWANKKGVMRFLLKKLDWITAVCATQVLADSPSQRDFLVAEDVVCQNRISVLADGSISGVNVSRFCPNALQRADIRQNLGIPDSVLALLYVGRLKREKGVVDLLRAFSLLRERWPELRLLLVGPDDDGLDSICLEVPGTYRIGYTSSVEEYMAAADIYCLPSYREGFGLVLIEAGAVGLPVIASRIYGITDAVVDGETGLLHEPGNIIELSNKIEILLKDRGLRHSLGDAGRRRAVQYFQPMVLTEALANVLTGRVADSNNKVLNVFEN